MDNSHNITKNEYIYMLIEYIKLKTLKVDNANEIQYIFI